MVAPLNSLNTELLTYEFGGGLLIVQPSEEGFMNVWIRGTTEWGSCNALGRDLAHEMACTVRCDSGKEVTGVPPESDVFLEISETQERLITLR
ncbi:MAG: hypothetical protein ACK4LR_18480 [Acidovorax temperans]|uniref:hypothetical protein n=1 Tax=Acidovorax temperans TaxID=80878 RepID=UPI00391B3414